MKNYAFLLPPSPDLPVHLPSPAFQHSSPPHGQYQPPPALHGMDTI